VIIYLIISLQKDLFINDIRPPRILFQGFFVNFLLSCSFFSFLQICILTVEMVKELLFFFFSHICFDSILYSFLLAPHWSMVSQFFSTFFCFFFSKNNNTSTKFPFIFYFFFLFSIFRSIISQREKAHLYLRPIQSLLL
jgi:hypothetical protein